MTRSRAVAINLLISIFNSMSDKSVYKNNTNPGKICEICLHDIFSRADETFCEQIASNNLDNNG